MKSAGLVIDTLICSCYLLVVRLDNLKMILKRLSKPCDYNHISLVEGYEVSSASDTSPFCFSQLSRLSVCLPVCLDCSCNYRPRQGQTWRQRQGANCTVDQERKLLKQVCKDVLSLICCHKSLLSTTTYYCHHYCSFISFSLCLISITLF